MLAIVRNTCIYISYKTGLQMKVGPDGVDLLTIVTGCSRPIVLDMKNATKCEEEASLNLMKEHLFASKQNFTLYLLSWKESDLVFSIMKLERGQILDAEIKLMDSYVVKCNNSLLQKLIMQLKSIEFTSKVDMVVDICIDREIARFYGSMESGFEALRDRIKATAITVTETATESSATLGIESAAQALGQAAIGVGITIVVDLALTSHSLYKAKKAKDMGLIDEKQFETKVKKKVCESGCQFIGGTTGSVVGQLVIPIPVVGAFVGGLCGSLIGTGIGKGVNYGLFERKESPGSGKESTTEFGLIASVLNTIKDRNPNTIISFVEKDNLFEEMTFIAKSNGGAKSLNRENRSFFLTRYLSDKKPNKGETMQQRSGSDNTEESAPTGWKRRYSDSVGIIRRRTRTPNSSGKLNRKNSLSAGCLDRCCEELTEDNNDNDDNGADAKAIANTHENKSAGQILSTNNRETKIMLKASVRPEDSYTEKNIIKTLNSLDAIIKGKEKPNLSKQKDDGHSQEEYEEITTENVKWNSSFFKRRTGCRKRGESLRENKHDGDFLLESEKGNFEAKVPDAGKEDSDARNVFKPATFEKLASIWKSKASLPESSVRDNQKGTSKVLNNDLVRKLIKIIHKREDDGASENGTGGTRISNDEITKEKDIYAVRNEVVDDELNEERMLFFTRHAAYGIKIRELAQNVNERNKKCTVETTTFDVANASNVDAAKGEKSDDSEIVSRSEKADDTNEECSEEQNSTQKRDEYQLSSFAKEFISKLKRNIRQRQKKREECTESQGHSSKAELNQQ